MNQGQFFILWVVIFICWGFETIGYDNEYFRLGDLCLFKLKCYGGVGFLKAKVLGL